MAGYLAMQIIEGRKTYEEVINKFPQYKEEIDKILEGKLFPNTIG